MELLSTDLIDRARAGDEEAFRRLVDPYLAELQVHCYRMLASVQDAEDALQETLLAAWRGLEAFEGRASMRTWLYRIATSRCLNALRAARRRPNVDSPVLHLEVPEPTGLGEVFWLEPYPDALLQGLVDREPGPEARYELREAISLAFVTALQLLPPRQRSRAHPPRRPGLSRRRGRQHPPVERGVGDKRAETRPRHAAQPAFFDLAA